ncbi:uncharacterized protein EV154DRAFT_424850, partial [Mucor mucedo]|uniref:uncharacterized protein n=1 Tax=Mucor mucedo TaxID=29922 RepID=UPI00221FFFE1
MVPPNLTGISPNTECEVEEDDRRLGTLCQRIRQNPLLNQDQQYQLAALVLKYVDCFGVDYQDLSQTNLCEFHVDTGNAKPIYNRPYSFVSHSEKELLKKDLEKMVDTGVLIPNHYPPSNSKNQGWSFPCRYVDKKTGDKRLVSNFITHKKVTVRDKWPLSDLTSVIEDLGKSKVYSALDLLKG